MTEGQESASARSVTVNDGVRPIA